MQVMLMRLMSKGEYLIVPKGTKFKGSGKLGLMLIMLEEAFMKVTSYMPLSSVKVGRRQISHPQYS